MQDTSFENIVRVLTLDQTPRVWSLLISVFGDLAQEDGAQISGPFLRKLTKVIGIKPEAMRVALHRLRKEGWIESRRQGRNSVYFLTEKGHAQTVAATPRIYATAPAASDAWLAVFNPSYPAHGVERSGAWMSSNILIAPQPPAPCDAYVTRVDTSAEVPDWIAYKVCGGATLGLAQDFAQALQTVRRHLSTSLSPLDVAVLRVLVVHGWRRIVLKTPVLPDHLFPKGWPGAQCRADVAELLTRYPRPPLSDLEAATVSAATPMVR